MTSNLPTVSVVIPAYNAAAFIERTLDSIRTQQYTDYEVIVVDDGSTDGTSDVVRRYFARYGIAGRCIQQPNRQIAAARNTGMRAAQGTYIALLDHDDLWHPEKLNFVMQEFAHHPDVDLICHNEEIVRDGRVLRISRNGPAAPHMYQRLLFSGNTLSPSATVFRKNKALSISGFREHPEFNTVEDYDFWMRFSRVAQFHFLNRTLGVYQIVEWAASSRIEYHHTNLEHLLRDHFSAYFGPCPGRVARLRIRRRLSAVYRSAATQLMNVNEEAGTQREYVLRMLRTFPFDPVNLILSMRWFVRVLRHSWRKDRVAPL